jgi:gamma-glutamyltranspeptidase/glutathione hydrolase
MAEALKIAFADRTAYQGDPAVVDVPVAWLTGKPYAGARRRDLSLERAGAYDPGRRPAEHGASAALTGAVGAASGAAAGESANTTHLTVMDAGGDVVAMTQTLNAIFGARVTAPGTGMLLNNCMALFDPRPGRPNSVAPRKRMLSSMAPTLVLREGRVAFALGTPGGLRIWPAVAQAIVNVIDHGMTLQEAVEAPRVWTQGGPLELEQGFPDGVRAALAARGHQVKLVPRVAGGMNGVWRDPGTGRLHGAACWRADGTPLGISGGFAERVGTAGVPL